MDFSEALKHLKEGKKVHLRRWMHYVYLFIGSDNLLWAPKEGTKNNEGALPEQPIEQIPYTWILSEEWEVYNGEVTNFIQDLANKAFDRCYPNGVPSYIDISTFCYGFKEGIKDFCEACNITPEQLYKRVEK